MIRAPRSLAWAALSAVFAAAPRAQAAEPVRVGLTLAETGPAASLGIPQRNTVALLPTTIGGRAVEYTMLDDSGDPTRAVANTRKLIDADHVDVVIGPSITPASLAMIDVVAEKQVPEISLAASVKIIDPPGGARAWVFKTPQNDSLMADAVADHMARNGVKTVAFIGFNDSYGDGWLTEATRALEAKGIKLVDTERYARADTSVTGQALRMVASKPGAVLIAAAGTPAVLPERALKERGFAGPIYQTHGVANADFLRVGGKDVEGTILPAGPVLVGSQLADDNPIKPVALRYQHDYEAKYGAGSMATFGAHLYDASILLQAAIPAALAKGEPGTSAFRSALRDALQGLHEVVLTQGVADMSPTNHNGFDDRARVMVKVTDGRWLLIR